MTDANKRTRTETPSVALMAAAAAQTGPDEVKRFASIFDKVPLDVMFKCLEFLEMVDIRQGLGVRALRNALGGKEPPFFLSVRELRLLSVKLEPFHLDQLSDEAVVTYIKLWRRHVRSLDMRLSGTWFSMFWHSNVDLLEAAIAPDTVIFPQLEKLHYGYGFLDVQSWQAILRHCPRLVELSKCGWYCSTMYTEQHWCPLAQSLRSVHVDDYVQPQVYIALANPNMTRLRFGRPAAYDEPRVIKWTKEAIAQLCAKWKGHGHRLRDLALGSQYWNNDMDEICLLLMQNFPELDSAPLNLQLRGATIAAAYAAWSFCDQLPPNWCTMREGTSAPVVKVRKPLRSVVLGHTDREFFASWSTQDVSALLLQTTHLEVLVMEVYVVLQQAADEKTLTLVVKNNPSLAKLSVLGRPPFSEETFFKQLLTSSSNMTHFAMSFQPASSRLNLSVPTLLQLVSQIHNVQLAGGVIAAMTSDDLRALGRLANDKGHTLVLQIPSVVAQQFVASAGDMEFSGTLGIGQEQIPLRRLTAARRFRISSLQDAQTLVAICFV
jgi:hypothetical protein